MEELFEALLTEIRKLEEKRELSEHLPEYYFEPGMMENLDQYAGIYDEETQKIVLRTEVKGLRYEGRTPRLAQLCVGMPVHIIRDSENTYNPNNFTIKNDTGESLGNLPAPLCNAMAPLFDRQWIVIESACVSYLEKIHDRSRYAKQGILFVKIILAKTYS